MGEFTVDQIVAPGLDGAVRCDATGAMIRSVFAKVSGRYAVYVTNERVMIQWADKAVLGDDGKPLGPQQRAALAPITALRGEINGLIDGWRQPPELLPRFRHRNRSRAKRYDRLVADALEIALAGDVPHATERLTAVRAAILDERVALGRVQYAKAAIAAALAGLVLSYCVGSYYEKVVDCAPSIAARHLVCGKWGVLALQRWAAVGFGALGAFLSVALQIRSREVQPNLQPGANIMDAMLRISVGAISATVLIAFMQAGLIKIETGAVSVGGGSMSLALLIVASVAAGFTERLVSNVIGEVAVAPIGKLPPTASAGSETAPATPPGTAGSPPPPPPGPTGGAASSPSPPPPPPPPPPPDDHVDGCPDGEDHALAADAVDATNDAELPEAIGGLASGS